jgi:hypothetical protein
MEAGLLTAPSEGAASSGELWANGVVGAQRRLARWASLVGATGTVVAGCLAGHALAATVLAGLGSWLVARRSRQYICFKCFLLCHLDYRKMRRKARELSASAPGEAPAAELAALWDATHERCARRCYETVSRLHGLWVKMAQMLACRRDILPEVYCELLGRAQDSMPSRPAQEVLQHVSKQLGRPVEEVFESWQPEVLGCASIAQVHRATLRNGRGGERPAGAAGGGAAAAQLQPPQQVVIKVQHPGVEARMAADCLILARLLGWMRKLEPDFDLTPIARQWMAAIPLELDFVREASNMVEMACLLGAGSAADGAEGPTSPELTPPPGGGGGAVAVQAVIPRVFEVSVNWLSSWFVASQELEGASCRGYPASQCWFRVTRPARG